MILYEEGLIDFNTCSRPLNIASNASPLFIVGTLGASMLKDKTSRIYFLASSYLSRFYHGGSIMPNKFGVKLKDYYSNKKGHL